MVWAQWCDVHHFVLSYICVCLCILAVWVTLRVVVLWKIGTVCSSRVAGYAPRFWWGPCCSSVLVFCVVFFILFVFVLCLVCGVLPVCLDCPFGLCVLDLDKRVYNFHNASSLKYAKYYIIDLCVTRRWKFAQNSPDAQYKSQSIIISVPPFNLYQSTHRHEYGIRTQWWHALIAQVVVNPTTIPWWSRFMDRVNQTNMIILK
jgi:hypothetical protein